MKKNDRVILRCDRLGADLEGICAYEGIIVFVPGLLPGEDGEIIIVKVQPRFAFGRLVRIVSPSPNRAEPFCPNYFRCGGCSGQHMRYEATLDAKREQVLDCLSRIGGVELAGEAMPPLLPADSTTRYRNKTAIPCGGTAKNPVLGFYRQRSHDIVPLNDCPVAMGHPAALLSCLRDWITQCAIEPYQEESGKGFLRHIVYRVTRKGDCMVTLCATRDKLPYADSLIALLKERLPGFCGLHLSVNAEKNNVILGKTSRCLYGAQCLEESLLGLRFEIPPLSFFQVNPDQTEKLYATAIDFASLRESDTVVDAYAGAGTISLCMAQKCKRVIGIEIVPQAVEGARRNAAINHIENADFYTGAVETLLPKLVREGLRADTVVLDPPRKGCEKEVLEAVAGCGAKRIVYVSCHYPTQARDVGILRNYGYRVEKCQSVDMFCWTGGVENIIALVRDA